MSNFINTNILEDYMPKKTLDNKENILKLLTKLDETNSALKSRLIYS